MFSRSFSQLQKYKLSLRPINSTVNEAFNKIRNYEMPERLKGTFVERWGKYWKNLYIDYKDVAIDVAKDCRERPVRASFYVSVLACCVYLCKHNPDESSFQDEVLKNSMKIMTLGESVRNPISEHHVKWLNQCYNQGIVRWLSLGIVSLIWLDNYDKDCSLYKAVCPYLKPRYLSFHERIVDLGFLDKWWVLENKMIDYDINEAEFANI